MREYITSQATKSWRLNDKAIHKLLIAERMVEMIKRLTEPSATAEMQTYLLARLSADIQHLNTIYPGGTLAKIGSLLIGELVTAQREKRPTDSAAIEKANEEIKILERTSSIQQLQDYIRLESGCLFKNKVAIHDAHSLKEITEENSPEKLVIFLDRYDEKYENNPGIKEIVNNLRILLVDNPFDAISHEAAYKESMRISIRRHSV